jgi:hypothetical protein
LKAADRVGVPRSDMFQTVDLYERKNPNQVLAGIFAFARHARVRFPDVIPLGPDLSKPSKGNTGRVGVDPTPSLQSVRYVN